MLTSRRNRHQTRSRCIKRRTAKTESVTYAATTGRITKTTDRKGQITSYTYDARSRLQKATFPGGSVTYTYDDLDRITRIADTQGGSNIDYNYDLRDLVTSVSTPNGNLQYAYDLLARRTGMTILAAGGTPDSVFAYAYNANNQLTSLTRTMQASAGVDTQTTSFAYDVLGRAISKVLPNGIAVGLAFDNAGQLTAIDHTPAPSGPAIGNLTYSNDADGRIISKGGTLATSGLPVQATGSYDAMNRLNTLNLPSTTPPQTIGFTYDDNGNATSDGQYTYSYDSRNRLITITSIATSTLVASYQYDAQGNRSKKTIAGTVTKYLHDGLNPIRELDSAGAVQADLISAGLDNIISRIQNPATTPVRRDLITDHLGSTIALTDESGTVKTTYSYDPYGKTIASGEASSNPFQYTGRENDNVGIGQDSAAGLYYYRARYYSPLAHRFTQTDPIGLAGGMNTFGYVAGDPVSYTDPTGLLSDAVSAAACEVWNNSNNPAEAWSKSLKNRKPWDNPIWRPAENYLYGQAAIRSYGNNAAIVALGVTAHSLSKPLRSNTTPFSLKSTLAGYEGVYDASRNKGPTCQCRK